MTLIGPSMKLTAIVPLVGPAASHPDTRAAHNEPRSAQDASAGTAVVPVASQRPQRNLSRPGRPNAAFVTHLIATATHAPQTRPLRRAAPADAVARYRITSDKPVTTTMPARLSRTA
ncbi:hypothetical protein ACSVBT_01095 [Afipia sp. TerB]